MMKEEFEKLIGKEVAISDYEVIEKAYATHPSIDAVKGKQQIANIYQLPGGMRIIRDMVPTAEKAAKIEDRMMSVRRQISDLERELEELKAERERLSK